MKTQLKLWKQYLEHLESVQRRYNLPIKPTYEAFLTWCVKRD